MTRAKNFAVVGLTAGLMAAYAGFTTKHTADTAPVRLADFLCLKSKQAHSFRARSIGRNKALRRTNNPSHPCVVVEAAPPYMAHTPTKYTEAAMADSNRNTTKPRQFSAHQSVIPNPFNRKSIDRLRANLEWLQSSICDQAHQCAFDPDAAVRLRTIADELENISGEIGRAS